MTGRFPDSWTPPTRTHGVFTRSDAYAAGMSRRQVDYRLSTGLWRYVAAKVIAHRDHVVTPMELVLTAGLARPGCLVVGRVAAAFQRVPIALVPPIAIQVTSPGQSVPTGFVGRMVPMDEPGILRVGGIARVPPERWSFIDALATMPWDEARNLYAYLLSYERLSRADIAAHLAAHPHRRGNGQLQDLLRRSASGALSEAEERLHILLKRAGITGWEANMPIKLPGLRVRADIAFPAARFVIEVDGRGAHEGRYIQDRRRDAAFVAEGWFVMRVTWWDIVERPGEVLARIRGALTHAMRRT